MNQRTEIAAAVSELRSLGVGAFTAAPPVFRLLWRINIGVPPPLFLPFGRLALGFGAGFAVAWLPLQWLVRGGQFLDPVAVEITTAVLIGVVSGVLLASYYRYRARSLRLPSWPEYVANPTR